jgi:hypothetical protein
VCVCVSIYIYIYIYTLTHTHTHTKRRPLAHKVVYSERNRQTFRKKPVSPSRSPTKAVPPSKNSVNFYQTTRCHVPEGSILHSHSRKNLKSQVPTAPRMHIILNYATHDTVFENKYNNLTSELHYGDYRFMKKIAQRGYCYSILTSQRISHDINTKLISS